MRWTMPYGFLYRRGLTPWDTGVTPPEVVELVEGKTAMPAGRALDLGCGTGNEVTLSGTTRVDGDRSGPRPDRDRSCRQQDRGLAERGHTPRRRHQAWRDGTGWPLRPGARPGMLPFPPIRRTGCVRGGRRFADGDGGGAVDVRVRRAVAVEPGGHRRHAWRDTRPIRAVVRSRGRDQRQAAAGGDLVPTSSSVISRVSRAGLSRRCPRVVNGVFLPATG
jgi:hypothetical protein